MVLVPRNPFAPYTDPSNSLNITTDVEHLLNQDPTLNSIGTPILFLEPFKAIPDEFLKLLGMPSISYTDEAGYSLNKLVQYAFGVNVFQFIGVMGLAFLASIVLVTIILPNLGRRGRRGARSWRPVWPDLFLYFIEGYIGECPKNGPH